MPEEEQTGPDKSDPALDDAELKALLDQAKDPLEAGSKAELEPSKPIAPKPDMCETVEVIDEVDEDNGVADVKVVYAKFNEIAETILNNYHSDREAIEDTIQRIRDLFIDAKTPRSFIVEGLVSAHKTKADTNTSIIKLLDSMSRMLSAVKGTQIMQENVTNIDLSQFLKDARNDDSEDDG